MNQTRIVKLSVASMAACLVLAACSSGAKDDANDRIGKKDGQVTEEGGGGLTGPLVDPSASETSKEGVPTPVPVLDESPSETPLDAPVAGVPTPVPVPGSSDPDCPAQSLCLYESADFSGRRLVVAASASIPDLRDYVVDHLEFNDHISSVINNSTSFIELWTDSSYTGSKRAVPDFSRIANLGAGLGAGNMDDLVSSIRVVGVAGN
ncbi:peptidase inhibitor family I36 protein [Streptomyces sp. NPDC055210]